MKEIDKKTNYLFKEALKKYKKLPFFRTKLSLVRCHKKKIISIEGINGSGKTTQINIIKEHFKGLIYCVPKYVGFKGEKLIHKSVALGNESVGGAIAQTLLFLAGETAKEFYISKHCVEEKYVLYDRYIDSLILCQRFELSKFKFGLKSINKWLIFLVKFLPQPDLTIVLDVDPKTCIMRTHKRRKKEGRQIYKQQIEEILNLRDDFLKICQARCKRVVVIDGRKSIRNVSSKVINTINKFMNI